MPKRYALADTVRAASSERHVRDLRARADQVSEARRWLRSLLGSQHLCLDDTLLVVSELVTNAIQHGSRSEESLIRVVVRQVPGTRVVVSVADSGRNDQEAPVPVRAGLGAVRGRGMALVDELATRWGAVRTGAGHLVYALISAPGQEPGRGEERNPMSAPSTITPMPKAFMLIGQGGPHVLDDHGTPPTIIDAEGVQLLSGTVYTWCHAHCCADRPRSWSSIEAAADYHGSLILFTNEAPRDPKEP